MIEIPRAKREPFFLPTPRGARFGILTRPVAAPVGGLLYVHPFAEEMNKSRRMATVAAQAFAARGWLVLQLDLGGCGDSEGDFGDVDWQTWVDDVAHGWSCLRERCAAPCAVWTLRAGCLVAADWLAQSDARPPLLLWQPVTSGQQHLTQFLRLKSANEMLTAAGTKGVVARLKEDLNAGRAVEVAGYRLSSGFASGLGAANLRLPDTYRAAIAAMEVTGQEQRELSPALAALVGKWQGAGLPVAAEVVGGPTFWQTQEIETAPELLAASERALDRWSA